MKYFPKISGNKVYLSPMNVEDFEIFTKRWNNPDITDMLGASQDVVTINNMRENMGNNKNGEYEFAIVKKDGDQLLGTIHLSRIDYINQTANLGIFIGDIDEHNKGYGSDAINTLLSYAFNTLNMYSIYLWVRGYNEKAISCYEKCGFKKVGIRHHCAYYNGKRYNRFLMEIIKPNRKSKFLSK